MNSMALSKVSSAIQRRLKEALEVATLPNNVYVGALDDEDAADADLVLFLFRMFPVADLRNSEHRVPGPSPDAPVKVVEGALALSLSYLLTAPTHGAGAQADMRALNVLGCAIQTLNDDPELAGTEVDGETVRISLDPVTNEEMSRIWTLFPAANFRTSVVYLATPVWIDPATTRVRAGLVNESERRYGARLS